ncbi:MAG: hypothetical protein E7331_05590 [Clostridiales bacterium]|nr:hypothetical protein [Clostridiales bacterium]
MRTSSILRRILCLALLLALLPACLPAAADTDFAPAYPGYVYPGAMVYFGFYEQDNNFQNGTEPVQWQVLAVDYNGGRVLLLSRYALEMQRFNHDWVKISWRDCSLRNFLNNSFYYQCFSQYERQAILPTAMTSKYVNQQVDTVDNVFCLDSAQVKQYFPSKAQRLTLPTPYAIARETAIFDGGTCYWWLRDTTKRQNDANRIKPDGTLEEYGGNTNAYGVGVRPAVWVKLNYFPVY